MAELPVTIQHANIAAKIAPVYGLPVTFYYFSYYPPVDIC